MIQLLHFCLSVTYLAYKGDCYQQIFGTAMRSSVSVTVANIIMEDVEEPFLPTTLHHHLRAICGRHYSITRRLDKILLNKTEVSINSIVESEYGRTCNLI